MAGTSRIFTPKEFDKRPRRPLSNPFGVEKARGS
jgi:hypothetical protein